MHCNKKPYEDKKAARTARNSRLKKRGRNRPDFLRIYYCRECGAWHLTKREWNPV